MNTVRKLGTGSQYPKTCPWLWFSVVLDNYFRTTKTNLSITLFDVLEDSSKTVRLGSYTSATMSWFRNNFSK